MFLNFNKAEIHFFAKFCIMYIDFHTIGAKSDIEFQCVAFRKVKDFYSSTPARDMNNQYQNKTVQGIAKHSEKI